MVKAILVIHQQTDRDRAKKIGFFKRLLFVSCVDPKFNYLLILTGVVVFWACVVTNVFAFNKPPPPTLPDVWSCKGLFLFAMRSFCDYFSSNKLSFVFVFVFFRVDRTCRLLQSIYKLMRQWKHCRLQQHWFLLRYETEILFQLLGKLHRTTDFTGVYLLFSLCL